MNPATPAPCPHCAAHGDELRTIEIDVGNWAVTCRSCEAIGPSDTDPARAAALWGGAARAALAKPGALYAEQILTEAREIRRMAAARRGGDLRGIERLAEALVRRLENGEVIYT